MGSKISPKLAAPAWAAGNAARLQFNEWIYYPDAAVEPVVLKILAENFGEPIVFRIRPEVRVEPVQLIGCTPADSETQHRLVRIEDSELFEQFFGFAQSVWLLKDDVSTNAACRGGNELHYRLMRDPHRVLFDATSKNLCCDLLLFGKPAVETVDQNIGINE